jgi:hypothetical protein
MSLRCRWGTLLTAVALTFTGPQAAMGDSASTPFGMQLPASAGC